MQEVQQFLGLASYYRRFIQNFAGIAKPLHRLTERGRIFKWTVECENAFAKLKLCLRSSPILSFPDFSLPFILDTDACQCGIGAVLSQIHKDGTERVVAFASTAMSKSERKYSVTRQELLAAVTFIQHFRQFLLGQHFLLRTDHGSLQWLHSLKEPEGQLARWLERLQEYDFDIQHRRGTHHQNADALSRHPAHQPDPIEVASNANTVHTTQNDCPYILSSVTTEPFPDLCQHSFTELRKLQQEDDTVGLLLKAVEDQQRPPSSVSQGKSRKFQLLLQQWNQLYVNGGLLFRRYEDCQGNEQYAQLVLPESLTAEVLNSLHSGVAGGHLGEEKTLERLRERFYWPGHTEDVRKWCQQCLQCAQRKTPAPKNKAKLTSIHPGYPLQLVAMDILGPLPESPHKNSCVLVVSDYFTRWTEAYALPNQEAETVAHKLVDEFFFRFSVPEQLHSDQGRQFESAIIKEVSRLLQINKTRTTPYHPQSDGLVERFNSTLLSMLATTIADHPWDWEDNLRQLCYAYNTSVHSSTGYTPFFLMFGRQARLPVYLAFQLPQRQPLYHTQYAIHLQSTLGDSYKQVRENWDTICRNKRGLRSESSWIFLQQR